MTSHMFSVYMKQFFRIIKYIRNSLTKYSKSNPFQVFHLDVYMIIQLNQNIHNHKPFTKYCEQANLPTRKLFKYIHFIYADCDNS